MEDPTGGGGSTSRSQFEPDKPKIIDTSTQNFEEIRKMLGFVDHTHFIHNFLANDDEPMLAIFAPRRFGKTSHMNMLKKFLEIDVNNNNEATQRKNYKIFEGTSILTNHEYKKVVEEHLGAHPVLHLDFKTDTSAIASLEDAQMHCRHVVHKAYLQHSYLTTSTKLLNNEHAQSTCKKWCDSNEYKTQDLEHCLKHLTTYLHLHFDKAKVYVLVDEFDAIFTSAVRKLRGHLRDNTIMIIEQICSTLSTLLEPTVTKSAIIAGAVITGVSDVANPAYFPFMHNFTKIKFLQSETFTSFYGATRTEVKQVIDRLVENQHLDHFEGKEEFLNANYDLDGDKIFADVITRYNGYLDKNRTPVFCLWSILQYLQTGEARNYWNETEDIADLFMVLKCKEVVYELIKLMKSKKIYFIRQDVNWIEEFVDLHDLMMIKIGEDEKERFVDCHIIFNFLLDHGYLGYAPKGEYTKDPLLGRLPGQKFKLPNAEIRSAFSNMVTEIVCNFWKIDTTGCTNLINDISLSVIKNDELLQNKMLLVYEEISRIVAPLNFQIHKPNLNEIFCVMYKIFNDANAFEFGPSVTPSVRNFLLLHKSEPKFYILWELEYNNSRDNKYSWREKRHIRNRHYAKTKKHKMRMLRKLGREVLVIATSMDRFRKISLSYSPGLKEKIFSISEKMYTMYPNLYIKQSRFGTGVTPAPWRRFSS